MLHLIIHKNFKRDLNNLLFFIRVFFHRHWLSILEKNNLMNIQIFIYNKFGYPMTTTYFNLTACDYQTTTQWDLHFWEITIWLIDDDNRILIFFLLDDVILDSAIAVLRRKRWTSNHIESCILVIIYTLIFSNRVFD